MRLLYSLLFYLATPLVLLHLVLRGLSDRDYLRGWNERFCWSVAEIPRGGIIIHAASVGEVNAAESLIRKLASGDRGLPVTVTTFTPTGSQRARALFGDLVSHRFIPFDLPGAIRRFLNLSDPALLIVMETELWPNLFCQAGKRGIPIVLANARVSAKSLAGYRRCGALTGETLGHLSRVAAQSDSDRQNLISLGVDPEHIFCSGNLKFDLQMPDDLGPKAISLRAAWGADRPVLIAASTHADDDVVVLEAFSQLLETLDDALLILVPRHPERFGAAEALAKARGLRTSRFSNNPASSARHQCHVIDAMGELLNYYASCDVAFIGGSFGPVGGHNALEAAALGKPVLFGPNMQNFVEISGQLIAAGAAFTVRDAADLAKTACALLQNDQQRVEMGRAASELVEKNQGALTHTLAAIDSILESKKPANRA